MKHSDNILWSNKITPWKSFIIDNIITPAYNIALIEMNTKTLQNFIKIIIKEKILFLKYFNNFPINSVEVICDDTNNTLEVIEANNFAIDLKFNTMYEGIIIWKFKL